MGLCHVVSDQLTTKLWSAQSEPPKVESQRRENARDLRREQNCAANESKIEQVLNKEE